MERIPVEVCVKSHTILLAFAEPTKVILQRKHALNKLDLEAQCLNWSVRQITDLSVAYVPSYHGVRLNAEILFMNEMIHVEALAVSYRLNKSRCHGPELAKTWPNPTISPRPNLLEVSFDDFVELATTRERAGWKAAVSAHALMCLASDAPRLRSIIVRLDKLIRRPPINNPYAPKVQDEG